MPDKTMLGSGILRVSIPPENATPRLFLVRPALQAARPSLAHIQHYLLLRRRAAHLLSVPDLERWYQRGYCALRLWRMLSPAALSKGNQP